MLQCGVEGMAPGDGGWTLVTLSRHAFRVLQNSHVHCNTVQLRIESLRGPP
jgi:hypothetical protein